MESNSMALDIVCTETAPCCLEMSVTVPSKRAKAVYNSTLKQVSAKMKLPGFRAGKIPTKMITNRFGKEIISETMEKLVQESVKEALEEKKLSLASKPSLLKAEQKEYVVDEDFSFTVEMEILPALTLPEYKGIQVTRNAIVVSDDEIEESINGWLEQRSTFEKVERPAQKNDMLKLSYHADAPEELLSIEKLTYLLKAENTWLMLREPEMLPGAQTALLEATAGSKKDTEIAFPDDFHVEELKGKTFLYHFEINEVQGLKLPQLDEKIFAEVGVKDAEELRARVRDNILASKKRNEDAKVREQLLDALLSGQDFVLPPTSLKQQKNAYIEYQRQDLQRENVAEEEINAKLASYEAEAEELAARTIRRSLLLREISKVENITCGEQEVLQIITMLAQQQGISVEKAARDLTESGRLDNILHGMLENKVLNFLAKEATQTEVEA